MEREEIEELIINALQNKQLVRIEFLESIVIHDGFMIISNQDEFIIGWTDQQRRMHIGMENIAEQTMIFKNAINRIFIPNMI